MPADPEPLLELAAVMRRLRAECPWKAAQTHRSLARHLLEETYETLEAIDDLGTPDSPPPAGAVDHLREELGDLLLQVYFHAAVAEQAGTFTLDDVARGITEKLYRRNPHVFGGPGDPGRSGPATPEAVDEVWQAVKAEERPRAHATDGLPAHLPALLYADKVLDRLGRAPSGVPDPPAADDLGSRLLALVHEAHADGVDPEQALRGAVRRLVARADAG